MFSSELNVLSYSASKLKKKKTKKKKTFELSRLLHPAVYPVTLHLQYTKAESRIP